MEHLLTAFQACSDTTQFGILFYILAVAYFLGGNARD